MGGTEVKQGEVISSIKVIREELLTHKNLYAGFLASIESALHEARPYTLEHEHTESCQQCTSAHDLAMSILDRIIGEE